MGLPIQPVLGNTLQHLPRVSDLPVELREYRCGVVHEVHLPIWRMSNDPVQQRGRLQWLQTLGNPNAGPGCCNGWFGPETLNAADYRSSRPPRPGSPARQAFGGPAPPPDFRPLAKNATAKVKNMMAMPSQG